MEIILTADVDSLGLEGDVVGVANGYARNFLIPKGFALPANKQNIKMMEMQKKKIDERRLKAKEAAEQAKAHIMEKVVTIKQKAGEEDKLYGSVTTMDIAAELEKMDINIDRRKISIDTPIKTLGEHEVSIRLHPEVIAMLKIVVEAEEK